MRYLRYAAVGWGVGEIVLDGDVLVHHDAPNGGQRAQVPEEATPASLASRLAEYFAGSREGFDDVLLDLEGATPFQQAVCGVLRKVPYGEVVTYAELAALAGHPNAQRAVGTFCAGNRFSIVVPCHRVIAANGIGPYGTSGVAYKRRLLELEGVAVG